MKRDYTLAAVTKVLDILEFLGQQNRALGLRELSDVLHIPQATMFRYLVSLEGRDYVIKNPESGAYTLGWKVLELSNLALGRLSVNEVALPYMRELVDRFQETVNLGVVEKNEVVYVEILESPQAFKTAARVGGRDCPHSTSVGKAMLAFLPGKEVQRIVDATGLPKRTDKTITALPRLKAELAAVRQRGYAVDNEETEAGACCVGAPIFDHRGSVIAAISISVPAFRFSKGECEDAGVMLVETASQISRKIGYLNQR